MTKTNTKTKPKSVKPKNKSQNKTQKYHSKRKLTNKSKDLEKASSNKNKDKDEDISKKPFQKLNCSPKDKNEINEYTCYTDNDLQKLRNMWNARHADKKITTNDSKEIWDLLKNYYAKICNKDSCWVRQMTKVTKMEKETPKLHLLSSKSMLNALFE